MKLRLAITHPWRRSRAFTLAEALIASTILMLIVTAVISFNIMGLNMATRSQIWLAAGDDARNAMRMLHQDIRTAYTISIGSGTNISGFTMAGPTNLQVGNALMLYPSTNPNISILYYYSSATSTLYRTNWDGTSVGDLSIVSANPITNDSYIFTETDFLGNILTNQSSSLATYTSYPLISIYLSFTDLQNPQVQIAPGNPVDFYQILTKVAPRQRP